MSLESAIVLFFPGQGSQALGMGHQWFRTYPSLCAPLLKEARDIFQCPLEDIMWGQDEEMLRQWAQPALFLTSIAAIAVMQDMLQGHITSHVAAMAGHSLGEYTALVASGSLTYSEGLHMLYARHQAMTRYAPDGGMLAVMGLTRGELTLILEDEHRNNSVVIANDNAPQQNILSGPVDALDHEARRIEKAASLCGKKVRTVMLPVAGPFHSHHMRMAAEIFQTHIDACAFKDPRAPLVHNATAQASTCGTDSKDAISKHMVSPVLWRQSQLYLQDALHIKRALEVGWGNVLTNLCKKTLPHIEVSSLMSFDTFPNALGWLRAAPTTPSALVAGA